MKKDDKTLRLIYPQWQGGIIDHWMPDIPADDSSRGYYLGAHLLDYLAPRNGQKTVEVPVSLDINDREVKNGISSYDAIVRQTRAALDLLEREDPDRIVTLGGDCSASVVPFTFLASKYPQGVALIWIDAHPDINLPGDDYQGYHAMALTACLGMGDPDLMAMLPAKTDVSKVKLAGVRSWDRGMKQRQQELGIRGWSAGEINAGHCDFKEWLNSRGMSKVFIHFDLDVLDSDEIIAGVGVEPGGPKIEGTLKLINDIAEQYELVGLTIAEPMFRTMLKMRNILKEMPLLK